MRERPTSTAVPIGCVAIAGLLVCVVLAAIIQVAKSLVTGN